METIHLNSIVQTKAGLVAGGELGALLLSTDQGKTWIRAQVSTDRMALITQITFRDDGLEGMAVGHDGWILRSIDGGRSWQELAFTERNGEPLMSIARLPSGSWIAVGAFGRALRLDPQSTQWHRIALPDAIGDQHLNRIVGSADGKQWLIVGERGLMLRSDDLGQNWKLVPPFYNGSFYNALQLPSRAWLVYGMRGNVFRAADLTGPWSRIEFPATAAFFGHALSKDGRLFLVGQGALVATSSDAGKRFGLSRAGGRATLTDMLVLPDGQAWLVSDAGLQPYPPRDAASKTTSSRTAP